MESFDKLCKDVLLQSKFESLCEKHISLERLEAEKKVFPGKPEEYVKKILLPIVLREKGLGFLL